MPVKAKPLFRPDVLRPQLAGFHLHGNVLAIGLLLITVLLNAPQDRRSSHADIYSGYLGKVIGITDGDTITVLRGTSQEKIRRRSPVGAQP